VLEEGVRHTKLLEYFFDIISHRMTYLPIKVSVSWISMSYDPKYREWAEKLTNESNELFQVYRGMPVFRVKIRDDPPQYRFMAPIARAREFNILREKIDQQLDKSPGDRARDKASTKAEDNEIVYFRKWQDCQAELEDMKRRETVMSSKVKEIQVKMEEISSARLHLQKEVADLRTQLRDYEAIVAELKKKK